MPKVTRVKRKMVKLHRLESVVDRIAPVASSNVGMKIAIYGRSGTGKTTVACTFPKPLLLIGAEDGMESVRNVAGVDFVQIYSGQEFSEVVEHFGTSRYKSGFLDTLGTLYDFELELILGVEGKKLPATRSWGMAQRTQWQACNTQVIKRLRPFLDLNKTKRHVGVLAQERVFGMEEDHGDLIMPFVGPAATPGVTGWVTPACNHVCQTFIRKKTKTKTIKIGKKNVQKQVPAKGVEYCLRTAPHDVYTVKFRVPKGTPLPEVIVDPDYDKLFKLIQGG